MKPTRTIFLMWLAWVVIILGFQAWATARMELIFPDRALDWTTRFTGEGYQQGHVYLLEPFMNSQVAWDSEYYLSIAVGGYNDPLSPYVTPNNSSTSAGISRNYAFFPFYPLMIRIFAIPLRIFGMNPIATATLSGVLVSALGTLLGMLSLYDVTRDLLDEQVALRAVYYLIIFPTGFFLLQVYTEGLFAGMAFGCLAMMQRRQWLAAAFLGVAASMTRAVGVLLFIPMLITWLRLGDWWRRDLEWRQILHTGFPNRALYHLLLAFFPVIALLIWRSSYLGQGFHLVETEYFGRGFLSIGKSFYEWSQAFRTMVQGMNPQHSAYYFTEFLGFVIAIAACMLCVKISPEVGWFSIAVVLVSWGSGPAQGIHRYILGAPAVFIALAHWGRNPVFDRAWTLLSILFMGALAMLFAFNMWVA